MRTVTYASRRGELQTYFDRTAVEAWSRLTSDAPVSRIRATVRAGRDRMRATLMSWLPADMTARRLLDAGCGTGLLSVDAARRGAAVIAIDLSPTLTGLAAERAPTDLGTGSIEFHVGDMLSAGFGRFDHMVAMDSLIHYRANDIVAALKAMTDRAETSVLFTFAPRTPALTIMHAVGKLFPRGDRSPAIEPVGEATLRRLIGAELPGWRVGRTELISSGFYKSQAMELVRA